MPARRSHRGRDRDRVSGFSASIVFVVSGAQRNGCRNRNRRIFLNPEKDDYDHDNDHDREKAMTTDRTQRPVTNNQ
jgi:hypothetical protein